MKEKVIVGLSGGVDSSVSCKLLIDQGYEVEGLFMRNWDSLVNNDVLGNPNSPFDVCPQEKDYLDALKIGEELGIKVNRVDFVKEYWDEVFTYFLNEYKKGRTPNPDVMCNKYIKFASFKKYALSLGASKIAMGHFAISKEIDGRVHLYKGKDSNKDQTYFLALTSNEQLKDTIFPVGELTKAEVREIAKKYNLSTATKKDSTGICFIGERNFNEFLRNYLPAKKGKIVSNKGEVLGTHYGLMNYTIGQRKGIGIGGLKDRPNEPWFVCGKDLEKNELIVAQGDTELLYSDSCTIEAVNLINPLPKKDILGKFRYRAKDYPIHIELDGDKGIVTYDHIKSVTPGQILAFYLEDGECLGGAIINEVFYKGEKRKF
ncbi:MAG: tRNA 2-thiouridine(34) synthase MnmA [Gammaproteobacteria bacterium]|nr:tRNA 2-thiouridine(34) synthase MnmA [Gammaproteobacteria bacterium]